MTSSDPVVQWRGPVTLTVAEQIQADVDCPRLLAMSGPAAPFVLDEDLKIVGVLPDHTPLPAGPDPMLSGVPDNLVAGAVDTVDDAIATIPDTVFSDSHAGIVESV